MACIVLTDATDALLMLKVLLSCLLIRMHACFTLSETHSAVSATLLTESDLALNMAFVQLCSMKNT